MSQENVEVVRSSYEFANRTHTPDFDAFVADCEWHTRADLPDAGIRRGHDGLVKLASEWFGAFDHFGWTSRSCSTREIAWSSSRGCVAK